mgnify:CR=1 FL=1
MLIRGDNMELSYNNLWKTLIDKKMKKGTLCQEAEISTSTISKMKRNELVSLAIILKICEALDCNIDDVVIIESSDQRGA